MPECHVSQPGSIDDAVNYIPKLEALNSLYSFLDYQSVKSRSKK
jgi:hypothetical protein